MSDTLRHARSLQQSGDLAAAETLCTDYIAKQEAASGAAQALLALCRFQQGDSAAARAALATAREIAPDSSVWRSDLGAALLLNGEVKQARKMLEQAAAGTDADATVFNRLGTAHLAVANLAGAEIAFRRAIELRPEWEAPYNNIAGVQMRQFKPHEALANYEKALALDPDNTRVSDSRNGCLVALGRGEEALAHLNEQLSANPDSAMLHRRLADVHILLDQDREADAHLRAALKLDPDDKSIHLRLAQLLMRGHKLGEARDIAEALVARWPEDAGALTMLATIYLELGWLPLAQETVDKASTAAPQAVACELVRGQIAMHNGDYGSAEQTFRQAATSHPDAIEPLLGLGEALMCLGRIDEAVGCLNQVAEISPGALIALAEARALSKDSQVVERMMQLAESSITARAVRSALCFALCKIFDRDDEPQRAFYYARIGNEIERRSIDYSSARQRALIDRIIETFSPALFNRLRGSGLPSSRPIFVCGMPRSGTTLVEQVIAAHADVHGAGELSTVPRIAASLQRSLGTAVLYPRCMDLFTAETGAHAAAHYLRVLELIDDKARYVVDKLPHNFVHLGLIAVMFPNARIIHLNRDPRDVAISNYFMNFKQKRGIMGYAFALNDIAEMIRDHDRLMDHWRHVLPVPIYEISYEALVGDFEAETKAVYEFLGLDWSDDVLEFHALDRPVRTASLWQVRQPLYSSSVERWRPYAQHLGLIEDLVVPSQVAI